MSLVKKLKMLYEKNPVSKQIVEMIRKYAKKLENKGYRKINIMNFCGTHEWTITYYGIRSLMPSNIDLVAGPGCPVCITPGSYVDILIDLSFRGFNIITYGDAFKLPASPRSRIRSLSEAKALGGKVSIVYSFLDAIKIAKKNPHEKYIFFAVGFETTMASTAEPLVKNTIPSNLFVYTAYRLTPPIMEYLLEKVKDVELHGVIAPGHVSAVIGSNAWKFIVEKYSIPTIVTGFEPIDVLLAIYFILHQLYRRKPELFNEYRRVVKPEGNLYIKGLFERVYTIKNAYWRGIGLVPSSGVFLSSKYRDYDARLIADVKEEDIRNDEIPGCRCGEVVLGKIKPTECPLFLKACTPEKPYGPCMVSIEGTCRIWAENALVNLDINI
ncbi:MAG: hydrogenase formation protein HypD [Desulfurococcales archaeon]|nr:hydrogenase formation protein HypD [Desulfurococcales archaeon]